MYTKQVCIEPALWALNVTLPTFAAECWHLSAAVNQYLLPAGCSAGNPPATAAVVDQWAR